MVDEGGVLRGVSSGGGRGQGHVGWVVAGVRGGGGGSCGSRHVEEAAGVGGRGCRGSTGVVSGGGRSGHRRVARGILTVEEKIAAKS